MCYNVELIFIFALFAFLSSNCSLHLTHDWSKYYYIKVTNFCDDRSVSFLNLALFSSIPEMMTACWWGTGAVTTPTVWHRRPGLAAPKSCSPTPAARCPSATLSAGSMPPSLTPVRLWSKRKWSTINPTFFIFPLNFPGLSSFALLGDPIANRNQLLLCTRQWRKPENWHHPTRKWQDWPHSH